MSAAAANSDARVLLLLCSPLPPFRKPGAAPLGTKEWCRIGSQLRQAGLSRPGQLLDVKADFWPATGLAEAEITRLKELLSRQEALDTELERLDGLGIRAVTTSERSYPARLRRLRGQAPPVLYLAGDEALLERPGLAVVGSRGIDEAGAAFTREVAGRCARDGLLVVTGGARGVDQIAQEEALAQGGAVIGVLAGNMERIVRKRETRQWIEQGRLLLLSPVHPKVGFTVGQAMARNKVIYALAEYGLVVSCAFGQGGTWAGAREVLRRRWVPLFVRDDPMAPEGNRELLRPAARPFPSHDALGAEPLGQWLDRQVAPLDMDGAFAGPLGADAGAGQDLFPLVWPYLSGFLTIPRSADEVAAAFHLDPSQAEVWLARAVAEGNLVRVGHQAAQYQCPVAASDSTRLHESAEAYQPGGIGLQDDQVSWLCDWPADELG